MSVLVNKTTRVICQRFTGFRLAGSGRRFVAAKGSLLAAPAALSLFTAFAQAQVIPGETPVDMPTAVMLFQSACLDSLPGFSGAEKALKAAGYTPNPETGTLYHPELNLSFNIDSGKSGGKCSMVFTSKDDPGVLGIALGSAAAAESTGDSEIQIDPTSGDTTVDMGRGTEMLFHVIGDQAGAVYYHTVISIGN